MTSVHMHVGSHCVGLTATPLSVPGLWTGAIPTPDENRAMSVLHAGTTRLEIHIRVFGSEGGLPVRREDFVKVSLA